MKPRDPWPMGQLEGYVSSESVAPNEPVTVHVHSTVGPFRVQLLRRGLTDSVLSNVGIFPDQQVDIPVDAPENGCTWPAATAVAVPSGSPSGLYIIRLSSLDGGVTGEIPFVVTAEAPGARTDILFSIPSSTYEAYSWWGGRSLYGHGGPDGFIWFEQPIAVRVSPRRPYLGPDDLVTPKFQYWEMPFIRWLERNGIVVDYCTSNELHSNPELLGHYRLIVTVGHDEYWSSEMRDHVEQFADNGGTVVILSGNSVWWQIRFDDEPAITCYKNRELDPVSDRTLVTVNWIDRDLNRPETLLTGVSFQYGALINGDGISDAPVFEVVRQHPVLEGTNLQVGDTFGTYADNVGRRPPYKDGWLTVIGYECDARPTPGSHFEPPVEIDPPDPVWRSNWERIIPVDASVSRSPGVLFYDRSLGEGELHRMDHSGGIALRRFHQGWRPSWDEIIPGAFGSSGFGGLLFYERSAGLGEFYEFGGDGSIGLLQSQDFWRPSWDLIVPGNFGGNGHSDLLLYDRAAGLGEFYATDGSGNIALLQSNEGWRPSWDLIVPGNFGGGHTDLLFYDRSAGVGEFYAVDRGNLGFLQTHSGWNSSWDMILPLRIGLEFTALLFYDRAAGIGDIYATDGSGNISLLQSHLDWRTSWKAIVPLKLDDSDRTFLLFYEGDTGYAELYSVDDHGNLGFIRSYGDPAFTLIARSVFVDPDGAVEPREYASMGVLRRGSGRVFNASTTDWSFGLSQSSEQWSVIDQITANLLSLYGSAPRLVRTLATNGVGPVDPESASEELRWTWDELRSRPRGRRGPGSA